MARTAPEAPGSAQAKAATSALPVLFVRGRSLASWAIGWFGGGYYSHVATVLDAGRVLDARSDVIDGIPAGVQIRPISYLDGEDVLRLELPVSALELAACYQALRSQLGKPYDQVGIWNFANGSLVDRNWRDQSAWFCSELAVWSWEQAGICPPLALTPNRISPGDACLIAGALGATVIP